MLPVQPGVTKFVGEDIATAGHGKTFANIDSLRAVIPDPVGIGITLVHFSIGQLPDGNPVAEREYYSAWNAQHLFLLFEYGSHCLSLSFSGSELAYHNRAG